MSDTRDDGAVSHLRARFDQDGNLQTIATADTDANGVTMATKSTSYDKDKDGNTVKGSTVTNARQPDGSWAVLDDPGDPDALEATYPSGPGNADPHGKVGFGGQDPDEEEERPLDPSPIEIDASDPTPQACIPAGDTPDEFCRPEPCLLEPEACDAAGMLSEREDGWGAFEVVVPWLDVACSLDARCPLPAVPFRWMNPLAPLLADVDPNRVVSHRRLGFVAPLAGEIQRSRRVELQLPAWDEQLATAADSDAAGASERCGRGTGRTCA